MIKLYTIHIGMEGRKEGRKGSLPTLSEEVIFFKLVTTEELDSAFSLEKENLGNNFNQ